MKHKLEEFLKTPKQWTRLAKKDEEFVLWVENKTENIEQELSFPEKVFAAFNGSPFCENGNKRRFISIYEDDWGYCGRTCICLQNKQSTASKEMWDETSEDKRKERAKKGSDTLLLKSGVDNPGKLPQAVAAHKALYADKEKSALLVAKLENTMIEKYGVRNYAFTEKGIIHMRNLHEMITKENRRLGAIKWKNNYLEENTLLNFSYQKLNEKFINSGYIFVTQRDNYFGINRYWYEFKHIKCDTVFNDYIYDCKVPCCPVCFPTIRAFVSKAEKEIGDYIENLGITISRSNRKSLKGVELDIYCPEQKIAIEHDGLYWHGEEYALSKNYDPVMRQLAKTMLCEENGIKLIHIFEDEWIYNRKLVETLLKREFDTAIDYQFKEINISEVNSYFEENKDYLMNDIQYNSINYGFFDNSTLIGIMSFEDIVMKLYSIRKINNLSEAFLYHVSKYNIDHVISYVDRKWYNEDYELCGFCITGTTEPMKWFFDKNKTKRTIDEEDYLIYDCGNIILEWNN